MMLSSLLRPKRGRKSSDQKPLIFKGFQAFRNATPSGEDTEEESEYDDDDDGEEQYEEDDGEEDDEDDDDHPVLPIFSAPILGESLHAYVWEIDTN